MADLFSRLSNSLGNEDWSTEQKALQIQPGDEIVCITASGDRPLHLLMNDCQKIVCVDANPIQNYLLQLKVEAMKMLDPPHYLSFLGIQEGGNRLEILKTLNPNLDEDSREYWRDNSRMIQRGVIYQGDAEKRARLTSFLYRLFRNNELRRLFNCETLEEQRQFLASEWNHTAWRIAFKVGFNPLLAKWIIKDPGFFSNIDPDHSIANYVYDRMMGSLQRHLAKNNYILAWALKGQMDLSALPPYLTDAGSQNIRKQLHKIDIQTANVITYLESVPENSFDKFSLSDVASYMDQQSFLRLLKALFRTAKPNARFCMRQFMSRYRIPDGLKPYFQTEPALEKALEDEDKAFVYHFTVGKILKN